MKQAAKLVIIDKDDNYLLMYRNLHPVFGNDPDLPGGTQEDGEPPLEAMLREVYEEAGIVIDKARVSKVYAGDEYSANLTYYTLYVVKVEERPVITLSWEHLSYEWLEREEFLEKAKHAKDTYMHMVYDQLK